LLAAVSRTIDSDLGFEQMAAAFVSGRLKDIFVRRVILGRLQLNA
jgi:hypothetical protein